MIHTKHGTSQEAWEFINEFLATSEDKVIASGGYRSGAMIASYDHFMEINKAWVDPEFDFGNIFGYRIQKWSKLISNYVDFDFLDIAKSEILEKEKKKTPYYNISWKFANTQTSGHACLLSLTFQRRHSNDNPVIIINIRSSEVTKRLLMDFLLVERIAEYIYGENHGASLKLYCGNMWLSGEAFTMYHRHRNLHTLFEGNKGQLPKKILDILLKFCKPEALDIKFKVHLRSVKRLHETPISPLYAKDLTLFPYKVNYPEDVITDYQRRLYRKKLKNKNSRNTI